MEGAYVEGRAASRNLDRHHFRSRQSQMLGRLWCEARCRHQHQSMSEHSIIMEKRLQERLVRGQATRGSLGL